MDQEIMKELAEVEDMVKEATEHEEYTEKYFILREGMIKLAGGFVQAALLSSLIGWTRHWLKTDNEIYKQIKEAAEARDIEKIRRLKQQIRQGWFWKAYREMSEELLGEVSIKTCQRYVEKFEKMGLISSRDPEEKTTYRARWYKANIDKIKEELEKMGYQLDYYKDQKDICQNDKSQNKGVSKPKMPNHLNPGICQNDKPCGQNDKPSGQNDKHLLYTYCHSSSFTTDDSMYVGSESPNPIKTYSSGYNLTKYANNELNRLLNEYSPLMLNEAIQRAIAAESDRPIAYIKGILKKWSAAGVKTADDIAQYEETFRRNQQKKKKRSTKSSRHQDKQSGSDLPESLRKQQSEKPASDQEEDLSEQQALIRAKLAEMNGLKNPAI